MNVQWATGQVSAIWTAPCETWQIDVADGVIGYGPWVLNLVDQAVKEHAAECSTCAPMLADELERRRRAYAEERAERLAREIRAEKVTQIMTSTIASLGRVTDPTLRAVLDLHAKDTSWSSQPRCNGCDQGCSCDAPDWPCSTIETVAKALGLEWPDDAYLWRQSI